MIGGHRILGQLGSGGQGVVYLGESPSGERVAVKVLRGGDVGAFLAESDMVRRVRTFCTAQVLETGVADGSPYIVSEYVDGPSLAAALAERGPLRNAELGRLAIGTMTALAAIHRAGVVHRDFKPANVLLGRDGPRVIDFGIAQLGDATASEVVGTPPYMAPEQFRGGPSGPPANLFAWASTIVCAATGRPPFGTEPVPAVVNRILNREPDLGGLDLGGLDGDLRELVVACLDKDPAARPTAQSALMRLLGDQTRPETTSTEITATEELPRPRRSRRWWPAVAVALAVTVTVAVVATRPGPPVAPAPAPVVVPVVARPMAATSTVDVEIESLGVTLHENPGDGLWVSSYEDSRGTSGGYVRDPATGRFSSVGNLADPLVSPGGRFVAVLSAARLLAPDADFVRVTDRRTGATREVGTVPRPALGHQPAWSADGARLLMTVRGDEPDSAVTGFVLVDPVAVTATVRDLSLPGQEAFHWGPDKDTLARETGGTTTVYTLTGEVVRVLKDTGDLHATRDDRLLTGCADGQVCVLDAATGAERRRFALDEGLNVDGWLDDDHVLASRRSGDRFEVVLLDLDGEQVRVVADGPDKVFEDMRLYWTVR
ncbi:serine/threonine-protein kinase [Herbidospora cretacea]|uniref:serine/threonine-protein kinase n=1 Tax=Herbidospora cretacea TaxID=28444 RepID=UPI000773F4F4|nr:serine/threonine-protein kinase [Herbidospora cretacea]